MPAASGSPEAAFGEVAGHLERAQRALVEAMPSARRAGKPLAEALHVFESALADARAAMPGWRTAATAEVWESCSAALGEAARKAERLRLEAPALDFEGMAMVLGDLMAPLGVFMEAERRL